jgi:hypothetical protein
VNKVFEKRSDATARDLVVDPANSTLSTLLLRCCLPVCLISMHLMIRLYLEFNLKNV